MRKSHWEYLRIYWLLAPASHAVSPFFVIKDTTPFISELKDIHVDNTDWLVCIDVKSFYTNIPPSVGLKACFKAFTLREEANSQQPPAEILTNLLEIVLKNNTFEFNEKYYKQFYGTAMGTKTAP